MQATAPAGRDLRLRPAGCHLDEEDAMPGFSYDGIFDPPKPEPDREQSARAGWDGPPVPEAPLRDEAEPISPLRGWWSADAAG